MAESASEKDEANPMFRLATRAGKVKVNNLFPDTLDAAIACITD